MELTAIRLRILLLIVLAAISPASFAQDEATQLDQLVNSYVDAGQFMGSVLVAREGRTLLSKGYGVANLEWDIPNEPSTKFALGSLTKQFTAACVLLLEAQGKLSVGDPISKYLEVPPSWRDITIFHLLTHTSGLRNITALPRAAELDRSPNTVDQLIGRFKDLSLEFDPGERMQYSNSGYIVLGALIEKVSGMPYAKFVQQNIFVPLGMQDSGYDVNTDVLKHRASSYSQDRQGRHNARYVDMSTPYSAGGLYSTTLDLQKWQTGLFSGKLLPANELQKMTTPNKGDYSMGFVVSTSRHGRIIQHTGGAAGFSNAMAYFPDDETIVIVLGNLRTPAPETIASKLGALAHGDAVDAYIDPAKREAITVPADVLRRYVGVYAMKPDQTVKITVEREQLYTQLPGQARLPLSAATPTKFFLRVADVEMEFDTDHRGKKSTMRWRDGGKEGTGPRISATIPQRRSIVLAPEQLQRFAGTYTFEVGPTLTITSEAGALVVNPGGERWLPESDHVFFSDRIDSEMEFASDANGRIASVTMHQGIARSTAMRQ